MASRIIVAVAVLAGSVAALFLVPPALFIGFLLYRSAFPPMPSLGISIPPTATLLHSHHTPAGIDWGEEFELSFTDEKLLQTVISAWQLRPPVKSGDLVTFAKLRPENWWPAARLETLQERYSRVGPGERYWTVWVDRENQLIYAEYGKW